MLVLESLLLLAMPALIGIAAQGFLGELLDNLNFALSGLMVLIILQAALKMSRGYILAKTQEEIFADICAKTYTHLQRLPLSFFQHMPRGKVMNIITYDAYILSVYICGTLIYILPLIVTFMGALILLILIEPILAFIIVLALPIYAVVMKLTGRNLYGLARQVREENAKKLAKLEESLTNVIAIKSFTQEDSESAYFRSSVLNVQALATRLNGLQAILRPAVQMLLSLAFIGLVWLYKDKFSADHMQPAELVSFILYVAVLAQPISGLIDSWGQTKLALGSLGQFESVFNTAQEDYSGGIFPEEVQGKIEFCDIDFVYPERNSIFKGASLSVKPGEVIALIGANGAGKSTLMNLLLRFAEPASGEIRLDEVPINQINLTFLRSQIGLVSQDPILFDGSLLSNITYGSEDVSAEALGRAIKLAQLDDVLQSCPAGLQTLIGDQGVRLSGGEKQRVALCRALLKNPKVLILDEPTSMFDVISEEKFVSNMRDVLKGRTAFIITHRPESLSLANRIFVIKDFQILPYVPAG